MQYRYPIHFIWHSISQTFFFSYAAAKSLQSCLTLCDPTDGSPPGSPIPGILQARTLAWIAITFSNACMHAKSLQSCPTLRDPWTAAHQAPLSTGFSRQEYWSGVPFPSPFSHIFYQYSILGLCGAVVYRSGANVILTGYMSPCLCFYSCLLHLWEYMGPALHLPQPSGQSRPQRRLTFSRARLFQNTTSTQLTSSFLCFPGQVSQCYLVSSTILYRPTCLPAESLAFWGQTSF